MGNELMTHSDFKSVRIDLVLLPLLERNRQTIETSMSDRKVYAATWLSADEGAEAIDEHRSGDSATIDETEKFIPLLRRSLHFTNACKIDTLTPI